MSRFGHNELDDPKTTQPLTYGLIDKHPRVAELYADRLLDAKLVTQAEVDSWQVTDCINIVLRLMHFLPGSDSSIFGLQSLICECCGVYIKSFGSLLSV